jgi:cysteine desulfurase
MRDSVYLDNAATTQLDPAVLEEMLPFLKETFANPSSMYQSGRTAREAIDKARTRVGALLKANPEELIFTGGATESNNMALQGVWQTWADGKGHIVTSSIEHPSVLETCRHLEKRGAQVTYLPCPEDGIISPMDLIDALRPDTRLVSIMAGNNVTGTLQPIAELADIAHRHGALFHTDAVQAVGKIPIDVNLQQIDLLSLSAHKFYGPKGIGALYVRKGVKIAALNHGGGQERGVRSGTENVAAIVGLGRAAEIAAAVMADESVYLVGLRERIINALAEAIPDTYVIGHRFRRLPGHVCLGFAGKENEAIRLLLALDQAGIAVSSGSACSASVRAEPSHVLQAMGFDQMRARGPLRISLGRFNTDADCQRFLSVLPEIVSTLNPITSRGFSPATAHCR